LDARITRSGVEAARRKFTPEFMNRLDKVVVFKTLGREELKKILDIELNLVQQRIFNASRERSFVFTLTEEAKSFLLEEGTDLKYGARHLKRAIERHVVQPLSNLIATDQVRAGDWIRVDCNAGPQSMSFSKEAQDLPVHAMAELVGDTVTIPAFAASIGALYEGTRAQGARSSRRNY
jgi:ATP-dependent Clp protease ATP-binding subunit ClpA